jgi:AcrR family transcriptional regulator
VSETWDEPSRADVEDPSRAAAVVVGGPADAEPRARPRDVPAVILAAARSCLLEEGYARLSTRRVAEAAGVPLSQIHYHFGSKQQLVLRILAAENDRLLERQRQMYAGPGTLAEQWDTACDFLETDLASGYVRVLQELIAASWSDAELAASVRELVGGWGPWLDRAVHPGGGRRPDGVAVRGRRAHAPARARRGQRPGTLGAAQGGRRDPGVRARRGRSGRGARVGLTAIADPVRVGR